VPAGVREVRLKEKLKELLKKSTVAPQNEQMIKFIPNSRRREAEAKGQPESEVQPVPRRARQGTYGRTPIQRMHKHA
jgi:hypothetical protein